MQKRGQKQKSQGFTIVETLIFLGVTAVMLISALLLVGGQQRKTEFIQSVRDIESQIRDVANDVATGYYSRGNNFTCSSTLANKLVVTPSPSSIGANSGCILLGRAIQFTDVSSVESYAIYTIAGDRKATNLADAKATTLAPISGDSRVSLIDNKNLLYGVKVGRMTRGGSIVSGPEATGIAFVSRLSSTSSDSNPGTIPVDVIPIGSSLSKSQQEFAMLVDGIGAGSGDENSNSGVTICLISGGTDQHANITIGNNDNLDTKLVIKSGANCNS